MNGCFSRSPLTNALAMCYSKALVTELKPSGLTERKLML